MFKGIGNIASLIRQAQQLSGKMQDVNDSLKKQRATASTGAGMVEVEVNGLGEVLRVTIDPDLVQRGEREMIEDLIPPAVNQAVVKARQMHMEAMQSVTSDLDMPGLDDTLKQLMPDGPPDEGDRHGTTQ
jgi:DNA-binding YbaB/EbfC family protein